MNKINIGYINQIITTIQGEGNYVGYPVILIRFNGCNLHCPMCDSKYTWIANNKTTYLSFNEIETLINNYIIQYPNIKHIMITGGEPFYQLELLTFIIAKYHKLFHIQIETNGYKIHKFDFKVLQNKNIQLNISPKLELNSYSFNTNMDSILTSFYKLYIKLKDYNIPYIFKMVYCKKWEKDILSFYHFINVNNDIISNFWMMPLTPDYSDKEFNTKYKQSCFNTIMFCKQYGFKYSPRIHVDLFKTDKWENCLRK